MKILITGGNKGIGKATAEKLLKEGYEVIIVSRNSQNGASAVAELKEKTDSQTIDWVQGDLSTIKSCYELAGKIQEEHSDINCFISNAGVWKTEKELNDDGLEMSFMVNYVAPYILSKELFPLLKENQPSRIVNVNSGLYVKGKLDLEKTPTGDDFHPIKSYANSKLCNVLFALDFAEAIQGSGVTINSVHPGVINTELGDSPKLLSKIVKFTKRFWKKPEYGAIAPAWLATSDELEGISGKYFNETNEMEYIDYVKNEELRKKLDNLTRELIQ